MHRSIARAPFALILAATLAASYVGVAAPARAQDDQSQAPPSYAQTAAPSVARLSDVEGSVALKQGDSAEQTAAVANAPIVAGDYLTTGADGRAEVQLDANTLIRAGTNAQLRFTQLDGANDVAQVAEGSVELRVFATGQDNVQVQTPSVDVEPQEAGAYLITVTSDGNTQVTSRSGSVAVVTPQGSQQVLPGRTMVVTGQASSPQYQYIDEIAQTDLEAWGDQRDQMMIAANSAQSQYVPSDMTGSTDLNQYGNWVDIPGYGPAWVPSDVAQGWSPYSNGSWVSLNYYGPTWVAAEPWGWAPYHYGRWFYGPGYGWAWSPGPRYAHPAWSPALVAFFGYGGGVGVGLSFGNVGWVPLAPGESYHRWWGPGASLLFNLSYSNYHNSAHGFVGVPWNTWQQGFVDRAHPMSVAQLQATHFYAGRVPVQRMGLNTQYTNRSLATNFPKPNYQRFNSISPIGGVNRSAGTYRTVNVGAWQRFDSRPAYGPSGYSRPAYAQPGTGYARPQAANGKAGWQRFSGAQQPQRQYQSYPGQQRQYQSYPGQRQYQSYPGQRQYQSSPTARQYSSYPTQHQYYPQQHQYYPQQRQYYPQQRQYYPQQRSAQSSRSAPPSHTSSGGGSRPHGPGRP
ncbi:MAG: DUF6600 domain-containing protein [Candidatus Aquilonibacter sp.]